MLARVQANLTTSKHHASSAAKASSSPSEERLLKELTTLQAQIARAAQANTAARSSLDDAAALSNLADSAHEVLKGQQHVLALQARCTQAEADASALSAALRAANHSLESERAARHELEQRLARLQQAGDGH